SRPPWAAGHRSRSKTHAGSGLFASFHRTLHRQLLQQRLRLLQIARIEALSEPPVNRSQQFARLLHLALVAPEVCHAHSREAARNASVATSACASSISENSGVGEKPWSAGARTAWASAARFVLW